MKIYDPEYEKSEEISDKVYNQTGIRIDPREIYRAIIAVTDVSISAGVAALGFMKMVKQIGVTRKKRRVIKRLKK